MKKINIVKFALDLVMGVMFILFFSDGRMENGTSSSAMPMSLWNLKTSPVGLLHSLPTRT
ncbi:hypothetical protein [Paenibacillus taihuensis]|uniref:hypothetical protein n=1 Tax=Paenibacillus taihuensis TaxID=1156355 RepID=UPI0011C05158|nr:hypothetical protein [Paenibacillus taihuensis]